MYRFFTAHLYSTLGTIFVLCAGAYFAYTALNPKTPNWTTTTVTEGAVSEVVAVSGIVDAKNTAELAFPSNGKITEVFVAEGQQVQKGEVLATLASEQLVSQRNSAIAALAVAQAQYDKLLTGATSQTLDVAQTTVANAQQALERTIAEEKENVANVRKILLSSSLSAHATDINTKAVAPTVSGSYICEQEGTYTIDVYGSNAPSGYSYRYSGLETGTQSVGITQSSPLGSCGLSLQFSEGGGYSNTSWTIAVPNTQSDSYIAHTNAYQAAQTQQEHAIAKAQDALVLAQKQAAEVAAPAQKNDITQAKAQIDSAQAHVAEIDAQMSDRSIIAPFNGTITDVSIVPGEVAPATAVVTLLASDTFELKARVLERDITKVQIGQRATVSFDAKPSEILTGKVSYVSPLATTIDGVAYFEATILLDTTPPWMKSGFNADINIAIQSKEHVLRIPTQYLVTNSSGATSVFVPKGTVKATTSVTVVTKGTAGFTEITGLESGQTIIAP